MLMRGDLAPQMRRKVSTMIITDVHAGDLVEDLVHDGTTSTSEFAWERQLRYYWDAETHNMLIRQCTGPAALYITLPLDYSSASLCNPHLSSLVHS